MSISVSISVLTSMKFWTFVLTGALIFTALDPSIRDSTTFPNPETKIFSRSHGHEQSKTHMVWLLPGLGWNFPSWSWSWIKFSRISPTLIPIKCNPSWLWLTSGFSGDMINPFSPHSFDSFPFEPSQLFYLTFTSLLQNELPLNISDNFPPDNLSTHQHFAWCSSSCWPQRYHLKHSH